MKAYKGFDRNLSCRGFAYEKGKTYEEPEAHLCNGGFHACERPLDVLGYYPPADSRYCEVELDDVSAERSEDDTKVCARKIKIGAEVSISNLVKTTVEYTIEHCDKSKSQHATGAQKAASATGDQGAASAENSTAVAVAWGVYGKAKGVIGAHIVCAEWRDIGLRYEFVGAKMARVDGEVIKADTYYTLKNGEFVEAQ